jgi:hypothetical protein
MVRTAPAVQYKQQQLTAIMTETQGYKQCVLPMLRGLVLGTVCMGRLGMLLLSGKLAFGLRGSWV